MNGSREHIRLYVAAPLDAGAKIVLSRDQSHYLRNVMRANAGDTLGLFNGNDGEWRAVIQDHGKHATSLAVQAQIQPQPGNPDLWLLFAIVKRARTELIAEKAAELGVREIHPVITQYTSTPRINSGRLNAIIIEAAEQCGLLYVPKLQAPENLLPLLEGWPPGRRILFCDESGASGAALQRLRQADFTPGAPWAVLTGPEGGFSPAERAMLYAMPQALAVSLGPRILRADTAAIAALTLWQSVCGDWSCGPVALTGPPV